jgi:hypothetical protein
MSFVKILDINDNFLRASGNKDIMDGLKHEIEEKLANLDDTKDLPYCKPDIVQLISSIEKNKISFLQADISAKQLYTEVATKLDQFKMENPGFYFLNDSVLNAYYS